MVRRARRDENGLVKRTVKNLRKMKLLKKIGVFLSILGAMSVLALGFYLTTNNIYFIDGNPADFSLYGWGGMLIVWLAGFWQWRKGNSFLITFAAQLAVVCFALDCWRLLIFAYSPEMRPWVKGIIWGEAAFLLLSLCLRNGMLALVTLPAWFLAWQGGSIVLQFFMPNAQMFAVALGILFLGLTMQFLLKRWKVLLLLLAIISGGMFLWHWYNLPGIHFYEAKVKEPAEDVKVSVVVPVYNGERFLKQCLDSIRRQTLKDIEIICVNDGSTDGSAEILAEYAAHDARFKIITQENKYIGAARNAGISAAQGEYIGFVDQDDTVSADYFEDLYRTAKAYDADVAIAGNVFQNTTMGYKRRISNKDDLFVKQNKVIEPMAKNVSNLRKFVWDRIYRRSFLEKYKVSSSLYRILYEDYYFFMSVMVNNPKIVAAENAEYYFRRYHVSESHGRKPVYNSDIISLFKDVDNLIVQAGKDKEKDWTDFAKEMRERYMLNYYENILDEDKALMREQYKEFYPDDGFDFDKELEKQREKRREPKEGTDNTAAGEKEGADGRKAPDIVTGDEEETDGREASVSEKNAA